jgi:rubrerythrin
MNSQEDIVTDLEDNGEDDQERSDILLEAFMKDDEPIIEELEYPKEIEKEHKRFGEIIPEDIDSHKGYIKKLKGFPLDMEYKCGYCGFKGIIAYHQQSCPGCTHSTREQPEVGESWSDQY